MRLSGPLSLPICRIVKLSPWRYPYDAAFVVRHDFENTPSLIQSIEASAQAESAVGAKGDYYFTTGTVRIGSEDTQLSNSQKTASHRQLAKSRLALRRDDRFA